MTALLTLADIQQRVEQLGEKIGATPDDLPTYGRTRDGGYPHIEVNGHGYHYVTVERGQELERITTTDIDELLWQVFHHATASLATQFEVRHRIAGQDFRRQMFAKRIALLETLSPVWAERERGYVNGVLLKHPYNDSKNY